jgi:mRNA interferase MazF
LKRGDVVLAVFPNTDGLTAKLRPVVIIQADGLDTGLPQVLVAMVTSN